MTTHTMASAPFGRQERAAKGQVGASNIGVQRVDVRRLDLEVHTAAERMLQGSHLEPSARGLLEHEVSRLADQIDEPLLRPARVTPETENVQIDGQRPVQVGHLELGNQRRHHEGHRK